MLGGGAILPFLIHLLGLRELCYHGLPQMMSSIPPQQQPLAWTDETLGWASSSKMRRCSRPGQSRHSLRAAPLARHSRCTGAQTAARPPPLRRPASGRPPQALWSHAAVSILGCTAAKLAERKAQLAAGTGR